MAVKAVIFDLGGVVIDWNPAHLYRKIFNGDHARMDYFLSEICTPDWNLQQDAGRSISDGTALLVDRYPAWEPEIRAYYDRWLEMVPGRVPGTADVMAELAKESMPMCALSNFSRETFNRLDGRFPEFGLFDKIFLSADYRCTKPDQRFYRIALDEMAHEPESLVFVDDRPENVAAAEELGMNSLLFTDAGNLRDSLNALGLPVMPS